MWPANNHDVAVLPVGSDPSGCVGEEDIEIKLLGFYKLKVSVITLCCIALSLESEEGCLMMMLFLCRLALLHYGYVIVRGGVGMQLILYVMKFAEISAHECLIILVQYAIILQTV